MTALDEAYAFVIEKLKSLLIAETKADREYDASVETLKRLSK